MKCELCHKADAQTALAVEKDGVEDEIYVCKECARREKAAREKNRARTRKAKGGAGVSMTVVGPVGENGEPPKIIEAIMNAFGSMVDDMEKVRAEVEKEKNAEAKASRLEPAKKAKDSYHLRGRLHLEGLHLIGELDAVKRGMRALGMELVGIEADGVKDSGHIYLIEFTGPEARARRVEKELLDQERYARIRLFEEMPRVFGDSLCRALAILKNCRLLSPGELFDLLSPLRLATYEEMLDGIDTRAINRMMEGIDLDSKEDRESPEERDRLDSERADKMNERFEDVVLNDCAGGKFL